MNSMTQGNAVLYKTPITQNSAYIRRQNILNVRITLKINEIRIKNEY